MQTEPNAFTHQVRTGVFICNCGGEISGKLDTKILQEQSAALPGVVYTACDSFPCNREGRARLQNAIQDQQLERVLIAGCTPRTVEKLFRQTGRAAGLDAACVGVANIREQCVYVHEQPGPAMDKAFDLIAMGVSRLQAMHMPEIATADITQQVVIIGAGLEALALAQSLIRIDKPVVWVSPRQDWTDTITPITGAAKALLEEQARLLHGNPLFTACMRSRVLQIEGHAGSYQAVLLQGQKRQTVKTGAVVVVQAGLEDHSLRSLGSLLNLEIDSEGKLHKERKRLRPERLHEDGIFLLSSEPVTSNPSTALFQVYQVSARVTHFLNQKTIRVEEPVAAVDEQLCTGCGNCVQHCPEEAIELIHRENVLSLARVDPFYCTGCSNCVVTCPVQAISLPGYEDETIAAQIDAALFERVASERVRIIVFACEWGSYAAADLAGTHHLSYAPDVRLIRMNCSARFDPMHILWAFLNGADGVFLGACPPVECHFHESSLRASERVDVLKEELAERGIDPRRLHLAYLSGDDGVHFVEEINGFVNTLKEKVFY